MPPTRTCQALFGATGAAASFSASHSGVPRQQTPTAPEPQDLAKGQGSFLSLWPLAENLSWQKSAQTPPALLHLNL